MREGSVGALVRGDAETVGGLVGGEADVVDLEGGPAGAVDGLATFGVFGEDDLDEVLDTAVQLQLELRVGGLMEIEEEMAIDLAGLLGNLFSHGK